jgi:hypothetical protein
MGQQQLLLLVLSTVIVGLATVAGIQAFSENQAQASQDALVQRGQSIASDIKALQGRPIQMGGIDLVNNTPDSSAIVDGAGYDGGVIAAPGAGSDGRCVIVINDQNNNSAGAKCASGDANSDIHAYYDADADSIGTDFGSYTVPEL